MPVSATHQPRTYRTRMAREGLTSFRVAVRETDLMVLADQDLTVAVRHLVVQERRQLEAYIERHPHFLTTLSPWPTDPFAPPVVWEMIEAAHPAEVGPMAAVAGALAQRVGRSLLALSDEIIVENGGDIFMKVNRPATVALYAGKSPLSRKVGLQIDPAWGPCGVCTSSGTVGHSLSLGRADAACVVCADAALADACATALGNRVPEARAMDGALEWIATVPGVWGALVVVGERLGAWGRLELVPL
jgi:ApbE superfamily uncharacterized protein (UPF0280 family)